MTARVVFDTNILFSAVGWSGNPSHCVEHARSRRILGITCVEVLEELSEKLAAKLEFDDKEIEVVIGSLLGVPRSRSDHWVSDGATVGPR